MHRIDDIAQQHREKPAVKDGKGTVLTYNIMAARINTIAGALLAVGVEVGSRVAIFQEAQADWICSMLAVMRVGAIYIPLDLGTPLPRLAVMVNDCRPIVIIVHAETEQLYSGLNAQNAQIINVSRLVSSNKGVIPILAHSQSPAVILYTSGSTGTPKGVVLKHSNLRNEVECSSSSYQFSSETVLQQSALSFDMSLTQIFTALAYGGMVYVVPRSLRGDSTALVKTLVEESISLTAATPSEYISWLRHDTSCLLQASKWTRAISGGEHITTVLMQGFQALGKRNLRLFNAYGLTEVTCSSNKLELFYDKGDSSKCHIPAGFTSPNCSVYIVDEDLRAVPVGIPGEILVGGAGVAIGYLDSELTREKFVPDTFATEQQLSHGWTTMYRTGDWGRWRADGAILIERRVAGDTQIKLRGLRIELRDVESSILGTANGALIEAVVSARGTNAWDSNFLVAHVVFSTEFPLAEREHFLKTVQSDLPLPQYMHPAMMIPLDQMPVNSSGKLDRRSTSALSLPEGPEKEIFPTGLSESEIQLKNIWEEVLPEAIAYYHTIDADSDFFHVGGNSILLLNLQASIRKAFGNNIPLVQLFESSTLRKMSVRIAGSASLATTASIDWEAETRLSHDLLQGSRSPCPRSPERLGLAMTPRVVVLTGATGFVGKGLLRHLIQNRSIEKIHCIAVRDAEKMSPFLDLTKVVLHQGDLRSPRLGLSELEAASIFWEADAIIHNGADVSHLKTYQTLKGANLESTMELVKMSVWRRISFHYVSTAGVALFSGADTWGEISAAPYPPPTDGSDGYTASKWSSERYLEKVHEQCQLPVWIHRPSSILRDDTPELDIFQNLLRFSRLLQAVPASQNLRGALDLVSLETVAGNIVRELHRQTESSITYLNQTGDLDLPLSDLKAFLENEGQKTFVVLPMREWVARAAAVGLHATLVAYFKKIKSMGTITFPRYLKRSMA